MTQPLPPGVPPALKHYRLVRLLGQGGMGSVYEGVDERVGERVAVKLLHSHLAAADPTFTERFEREAHMAALLRSPYTVHLLDFGQQDGRHFMVMEFIDGQSLADILKGGPIEPGRALWVAGEVARALEEAGARGIVHRDIKPDNILFDQDGRVKVADFGIARSMTSGGLTVAGGFLGTPAYAAPEQADGTVDPRTDIYSVGITLFAMLTGRPPYSGSTPLDVMMQHRTTNLPMDQLQFLPAPVQNIVRRSCEKDPLDRYQTATEMAGAIDRARQALQRGAATGAGAAAAASVPPPARMPSQPPGPVSSSELPTAVASAGAQPQQPGLASTQVVDHHHHAETHPGAAAGGGKRKVVYFYVAGMVAAIAVAVGIAIFLSSGGGGDGDGGEAQQAAGGGQTPTATVSIANDTDFQVTAVEFTFDRGTLLAPPNTQVTYTLHNEGSARHSLQFRDRQGGQELTAGATGPVTDGGQTSTVTFTTPAAGTYFFECVNHPSRMNGTFEVKEGAPAPQQQATPGQSAAEPVTVDVQAVDLEFDKGEIEAPAGAEVTVNLTNAGTARHSIQFLDRPGGSELAPGSTGSIINGGQTDSIVFTAPAPGSYHFECAVHPGAMNGSFVVTEGGNTPATAAATATPLPSVTPPISASRLGSGMTVRPIAAVNLTDQPSGSANVLRALQTSDRLIVVTNTPPNSTFHQTEGLLFWRVVIEGTQTVGWVPEVSVDGSQRFLEPVE